MSAATAIAFACPNCGAGAGEPCVNAIPPSIAASPHADRVRVSCETRLASRLALVAP